MRIGAAHRSWLTLTAVFAALAGGTYIYYARAMPHGPDGGSVIGLGFGVLGAGMMVVAGLLSVRKRLRVRRIGSARLWMNLHIWLSLMAVLCVWFHTGFQWGGPLTSFVMLLFYGVIGSGILGLWLQQWLPALMTRELPLETVHGQIGHVRDGLAADAYEIVAAITGALPEAIEETARLAAEQAQAGHWKQERRRPRQPPADTPAAGAEVMRAAYLDEIRPYLRGAARGALPPDLTGLMLTGPTAWRGTIEQLQSLCEEARQLRVQQRLHRWLHAWLLVHAPLSVALFVLLAIHVITALRYDFAFQ